MDNQIQENQPILQQTQMQQNVLQRRFKFQYLLIIGLAVILIIIIVLIFITSSNPQGGSTKIIISPTPTIIQTTTIPTLPPENQQVFNDVRPDIEKLVQGTPFEFSNLTTYDTDWAIAEISNPNTDPGKIILRKINDKWTVVLGPGTYFEESELQTIGAPQRLITDLVGF